jgi:hypothetical protein
MKNLALLITFFLLLNSCANKLTSSEKIKILMTEYESMENEDFVDSSFEGEIYDLRAEAVEENNLVIVKTIDSLLIEGIPAPDFKQNLEEFKTINDSLTIGRKCRTVDNAPGDVLRKRANSLRLPNTPISIPVVFHVIQSEKGDGFIDKRDLEEQLRVLNEDFSNTIFSFTFAGEDYTKNNDWYSNVDIDNKQEKEMHAKLKSDPATTLNVYFVGNSGYLGYAQFPWEADEVFDGVVIYNASILGGSLENYNLGRTLTHEVGHYLGLWHTFHKGCSVGDDVSDTPAQAIATNGCPNNKDTCPAEPGNDPVENFMDYSYDSCMTEFTEGQNTRMNWAVRKYRPGLISTP